MSFHMLHCNELQTQPEFNLISLQHLLPHSIRDVPANTYKLARSEINFLP